jgi:hypothetical protein
LTGLLVYTSTPKEPKKQEFIRRAESPPKAERNKAAKKYHGEFVVLNFPNTAEAQRKSCARGAK